MSLRIMLARDPATVLLYGYDPDRNTFFAQLRKPELDFSDDFPAVWLGLQHRITRARTIAEKIRPYADFGEAQILELEADRAEALRAPPGLPPHPTR